MTHFLVLGCCWCLAKCPNTCPFQWEPNTFFCHEKCSLSVISCKVHFAKCSLTAITLKLHFAKCSFTQTTLKLHITKCSFNVITLKLHFAICNHQNFPSEISVCHPPQTYLAQTLKDHKYKLVTSSGSNVPWEPCIPRWSSQAHKLVRTMSHGILASQFLAHKLWEQCPMGFFHPNHKSLWDQSPMAKQVC